MDLQGQNMYSFSELVCFPDNQTYQIQQFLSEQGANIEVVDEVEIDQHSDVFQLSQNINTNANANNNTEEDESANPNSMDYQPGSVEIETVTTDFMDMPSFDDLLDFNHFEFVGNHVSVAYDGKITASNDLDMGEETDVDIERRDITPKLLYSPSSCEISKNSKNIGNSSKDVRKRKSRPDSSDEDDEATDFDDDSESERRTNEERENKVVSQFVSKSGSAVSKSNTRSRGTALIKYRFVTGLRSFVSKIEIMKMRTGAQGSFKAIFENEEYNPDNISYMLPARKKKETVASPATSEEKEMPSSTECKSTTLTPEPDHSYSATILTQKESSPTVHDHQYNEATTIPGKNEKPRTKKQHFFIKGRYQREKVLLMLMETLFTKKRNLEASTCAWIEFTVDYEDYTFSQQNIKEASSMLRKKRRIHQVFSPITQSRGALEGSHISNPSQAKHEIIIKAPKSSYRLNQTNKIVDSHGTTMKVSIVQLLPGSGNKVGPCIQFLDPDPASEQQHPDENLNRHRQQQPKTWDDTPVSSRTDRVGDRDSDRTRLSMSTPFHSEGTHYYIGDSGSGTRVQSSSTTKLPEQMEKLSSRKSTPYETENEDFPSSPTGSGNAVCGGGSFSPVLSPATTEAMFVSVSTQSIGVGLNSATKETTDFGTNTEPICGKCFSNQPFSSHSHTQCNEIFWIRCFNPLCHYMVHASCIGFYVSSPFHLKILPPYFCENHRT